MLDLLRFLSALIVFLYHFHFNLPGYQAVMVFFVLSGYFISSSVLKSIRGGAWNWTEYLIRRVVRLWIVLIPSLVLTYVWAKLQVHFFGGSSFFLGNLDFKTLLGNLFFLQDIKVKQFGLNGPLWSLSYEFWYYILFPSLLLIWYSKNKATKMFYLILFISISLFVGKHIMMYFLIWLLGAAVAIMKPVKFKNIMLNIVVFIFLLLIAAFSTKGIYQFYPKSFNWMNPNFIPDLSVGIAFAMLIYWIIVSFSQIQLKNENSIAKKMAGFSYTLYLVHYPLLYFWQAWTSSVKWNFGKQNVIHIEILYLVFIVFYSYVLALVTENKTAEITKKIIYFKRKNVFNKCNEKVA